MSDNSIYRWNLELRRHFLERELCHSYGFDYAELIWARQTLTRLETARDEIGYSDEDRADLRKARDILDRTSAVEEFYDPNQPRDANGRWSGSGTLDVQRAVAKLETAGRVAEGRCAAAVREAIEAGGVVFNSRPASGLAKDYGPTLQSHGFDVEAKAGAHWGFPPDDEYTPQAGDVAVIRGTSTSKAGHMAMYSGSQWISDFKQDGFFPGPGYRAEKPSYVIYRHKNP